jgi:hypothetical protein
VPFVYSLPRTPASDLCLVLGAAQVPHTVADGFVDRNELAMVFYTAGPTLSDPIELKLFALLDNR